MMLNFRVSGLTGIDNPDDSSPLGFQLDQNYPNPFNPSTTISFAVPVASRMSLKVYNLLGQEVASLVNGERAAGTYNVVWDGKDNASHSVASGIYFYRIEATPSDGGHVFVQAKKMILLR